MSTEYEAIVVGARCGGSPTAMLVARGGYRVLLVDRTTFTSDTMSTHLAHPPGGCRARAMGHPRPVEATNCPPITRYSSNFGPVSVAGTPRPANGTANGTAKAYCPRRIVLDALLVEAAAAGGSYRPAVEGVELLRGHVEARRPPRAGAPRRTLQDEACAAFPRQCKVRLVVAGR